MKRSSQKRRTNERKRKQARAWAVFRAACSARGIDVPAGYAALNQFGRMTVTRFYNKVIAP